MALEAEEAARLTDYKDGNKALSRAEAKPNKSILSRVDADGEGDHPQAGADWNWVEGSPGCVGREEREESKYVCM